jgi:uncharacterized membrane protein YbjE (DUF340 family)
MITVLVVMLAGILIGFTISRFPSLIKANDKLISWAIYLLLLLLGISVGLNKTIIQNLDKIGIEAAIITIGAIAGSVLTLWLIYRMYFYSEPEKGGSNEE